LRGLAAANYPQRFAGWQMLQILKSCGIFKQLFRKKRFDISLLHGLDDDFAP